MAMRFSVTWVPRSCCPSAQAPAAKIRMKVGMLTQAHSRRRKMLNNA